MTTEKTKNNIFYNKVICISIIILSILIWLFIEFYRNLDGYSEPEFIIKGSDNILQNTIINIEVYSNGNTEHQIKTALHNGTKYNIKPKYAYFYNFYVYHKGAISHLSLENLYIHFNGSWDRINELSLYVKNDELYVEYFGLKSDKKKNWKVIFPKVSTPIDDYINQQIPDVTKTKEREELKQKFLGLYE